MSVHRSPRVITRPLTPPHDVEGDIESALQFLREDVTTPQLPQNTPPNSSPFRSSPSQRSKRVEFHPVATFLATPGRRDERIQHKPKSILKTSSPLPTSDELSSHSYFLYDQGGIKMLESAVQHLDGQARDARLDAYLAINGVLSAYDDMPTLDQWKQHLGSLRQYILRDIKERELQDSVDTNIVFQAIKLAAFMLHDELIVKLIDCDFQTLLMDRIVAGLGESSKQIMKTSLGFLSQQRLNSSILTASRMEKTLAALNELGNKSKGVVIARLAACQRFVDQVPATMLSKMLEWLPHVLNGMLSDMADVRQRAVDLGMHVAMTLGRHAQAPEALHMLLEIEDDGTAYFEHFTLSLAKMLKHKDARLHVPQIWAVIVLFHRNRRLPVYNWKRFRAWLLVLQECMNCADIAVKQQANIAWRKLAYVVQPDAATPARVHFLLKEPIRLGFAKVGSDRAAKQSRKLALDSYYNLLHYALRPGLQHEDLDIAWDTFVVELLQPMITASSKGRSIACAVITGLLTPNTGLWNADAVLQDAAILPQDLPHLDSRWVRSRISRILKLVALILEHTLTANEELFAQSQQMFESMLKSVIEAGLQEVKLSTETKSAVAGTLVLLHRLWTRPDFNGVSLDRLQSLLLFAFKLFDSSTMTNPFLLLEPNGELLVYSQTGTARSPLCYLLRFAHDGEGSSFSASLLRPIIQMCMPLRSEAQRQWLLSTWQSQSQAQYDTRSAWSILANLAAASLDESGMTWTNVRGFQSSVDPVISLLQAGLEPSDLSHVQHAVHVLTSSLLFAANSASISGSIMCVMEPLAKFCLDAARPEDKIMWNCTSAILASLLWPENPQDWMDVSVTPPYQQVAKWLGAVSQAYYDSAQQPVGNVAGMLLATASRLEQCPAWCKTDALAQCASVFTPWVQYNKLEGKGATDGQPAYADKILEALRLVFRSCPENMLQPIEPYLLAAFRSTIPTIVEAAIAFWNEHDTESELELSTPLRDIIRSLGSVTSVRMRPESIAERVVDLPYFHVGRPTVHTVVPHKDQPQLEDVEMQSDGADVSHSLTTHHSAGDISDKPYRRRHDDSQVDFTPVASSPQADSQLFTDRQLEVRDRQRTTQLSSSPMIIAAPISLAFPSSAPGSRVSPVKPRHSTSPAKGHSSQPAMPSSTPTKLLDSSVNRSSSSQPPLRVTPAKPPQVSVSPAKSLSSQVSVSSVQSTPSARSAKRQRKKEKRATQAERRLRSQSQHSPDAQLQHEAAMAFHASQSMSQATEPSPSNRKRRQAQSEKPSKRRKRGEEDIGDEIVVASSRPKSPSAQETPLMDLGSSFIEESCALEAPSEGLLQRLRNVLKDFQDAILSPSQERSVDDVLFSLRQANHEAGRRGRLG